MTPAFAKAMRFVVPWGEFKDLTIDEAAVTDRGLKWLDYMRGQLDKDGALEFAPERRAFRDALRTYLDDETIAGELNKIVRKA